MDFDRCDICVLRKLLNVLLFETARRIAGVVEFRQRVANIIYRLYLLSDRGEIESEAAGTNSDSDRIVANRGVEFCIV